jgi:hypothetical protein
MKKHFAIAILVAANWLLAADASGKWVLAEGGSIEYRWTLPAKNACEISFRDLHKAGKTRLVVRTSYYPHKAQKTSTNQQEDRLTVDVETEGKVRIFGCEGVASVEIQQAHRD